MYFDKELELINEIKKKDIPIAECDRTINEIGNISKTILDISYFVDVNYIGANGHAFTQEDLKDKFKKAREAMTKINGLCKSYNFPLIYPDNVSDEKKLYKISCQYGKDVDSYQDIWSEKEEDIT